MNENLFYAGGSNISIRTVVPYLFHTNPLSLTFTINFSLFNDLCWVHWNTNSWKWFGRRVSLLHL